jgi:hypothetical protein
MKFWLSQKQSFWLSGEYRSNVWFPMVQWFQRN